MTERMSENKKLAFEVCEIVCTWKKAKSGLNWILFVWTCVSLIFFAVLLIWEIFRYRRTSHDLKMLREDTKRNRSARKGESDYRNTSVDGGNLYACWIRYCFHFGICRIFSNLLIWSLVVTQVYPKWKWKIYIRLWRKSSFPSTENQCVIVQISHLLCDSGFVGVTNSLCLFCAPHGKYTTFYVLHVHGVCVGFPSSRRRRPVTCCANLVKWAKKRSPWILHFNSGACNGCDIEVVALLTPRYDV